MKKKISIEDVVIAHCIASMDKNSGGTTSALLDLLKEESKDFDLELYTIKSENQIEISIQNLVLHSKKTDILDYSSDLRKSLRESNANIFHGHALWNLPMHQMSSIARKKNKPYILSIHGMLEPWSLKQSQLKKKIAMFLYQHADLKLATCLHATGQMEADSIRNLGYQNPIANIPNGINLAEYPQKKYLHKTEKTILFLSRIHPKKGIEILIQAWQLLDEGIKKNWKIKIAGNGEETYINKLNQEITSKNLSDKIDIIGSKFASEKLETYHNADLFVLPTYSENFGIVVAEALSCGVAVITTKGTPWRDLKDYKAGAWIEIGVEPLKKALEEFLQKDSEELIEMGKNGRKLVEEKYSIESVGKQFLELYDWILNKTEKPDFVV